MKGFMSFCRFLGKGTARNELTPYSGVGERVVNDNRAPLYLVLILDTSGSMTGISTVINEMGEAVSISKIEQLNQGVQRVVKSLREFEANNPLRKIYLQIIELNSYGKAVFPEFQPMSRTFEEICFEANGCTELGASLATLKTFINHKYLRDDRPCRKGHGYNKPVNVILMSDGWPTDTNGIQQSGPAYRNVIDEFKNYLVKMDYYRNMNFYSLAVGDDACEDMLRYFCDGDEDPGDRSHFYRVEECESLASALDFLTRATLAERTASPVKDIYERLYDDLDEESDDSADGTSDNASADMDSNAVLKADDKQTDGGDGTDNADFYDDTSDGAALDEPIVYQIDVIKCKKEKCLACIGDKCPAAAIVVNSGIVSIDPDKCIGCGVCEGECPYEAIRAAETDTVLDGLFDDIE